MVDVASWFNLNLYGNCFWFWLKSLNTNKELQRQNVVSFYDV